MREYIITVSDPAVWDTGLWDELTVDGLGDNFIPDRSVEVINERPFNDYSAHFNLTDEEADLLRQDSRIAFVELQADLQEGVEKGFSAVRASANYNRHPGSTTSSMKNWGLLRCINQADPYGTNTSVTAEFPYNLDGTGVDVIVMDSGVEPNHPEFAVNSDGTGGSRVVDFNWASLGVPGTASASSIGGYLGDADGHGSHCASVSCGNTQGWASGAAIYSLRIFDGNNIRTGAYLGAINSDIAFDIVRAFHLAKIAAGNTRPTICTNSWGYRSGYSGMISTVWRGTTYSTTSRNPTYGQVSSNHPYVVNYLDVSATNCINAGVILVGAAGNYYHKADIPGGIDYDNYYNSYYGQIYYHRGSSPTRATGFINVGAVDTIQTNPAIERKSNFSETGPRVDVYAPGSMVMGAYANKPYSTNAVPDPRNSSYYLNKVSGTSMACPQVTGVLACFLQARPSATAADCLAWLIENSTLNALNENPSGLPGGGATYTNNYYLQGGNNRVLHQPFKSSMRGSITS